MDDKERLINNILIKSSLSLSKEQINTISNILTVELNEFEVVKKSTEVALRYEDNYRLLRKFLNTKKIEGLSDKSLKRYADVNNKLLNYLAKPITDITTNDIRFYLAMCKNKGNSNVTIDGYRRIFSSMFSWLTIEGYIKSNPTICLKQIKCEKIIKQPFDENELSAIRKSCGTIRDKVLVEFMYCTGARVSEVSKVKIQDVNFDKNELIVHGKGNKQRYVYLSDECLNLLHKYLKSKTQSSVLLFDLSKNGIEQVVSRIGKKTGIHCYPHRFRRSCACSLLNKGMNIYNVSRILGHTNLNTTERYLCMDRSKIKDEYKKCMNHYGYMNTNQNNIYNKST